jgi:hypothetical protein
MLPVSGALQLNTSGPADAAHDFRQRCVVLVLQAAMIVGHEQVPQAFVARQLLEFFHQGHGAEAVRQGAQLFVVMLFVGIDVFVHEGEELGFQGLRVLADGGMHVEGFQGCDGRVFL